MSLCPSNGSPLVGKRPRRREPSRPPAPFYMTIAGQKPSPASLVSHAAEGAGGRDAGLRESRGAPAYVKGDADEADAEREHAVVLVLPRELARDDHARAVHVGRAVPSGLVPDQAHVAELRDERLHHAQARLRDEDLLARRRVRRIATAQLRL